MREERALVNKIRLVMEPVNPVPAGAHDSDVLYQADLASRIAALRQSDHGLSEHAFSENGVSENGVSVGGRLRLAGRDGGRGAGVWRAAAPVLSGLAVVAVVVSLTLAGRSPGEPRHTGPATGGAVSLPRYYLTINNKTFLDFKPSRLVVHSTRTGKVIASLLLPKSKGLYGYASAATSDREFLIVSDRTPGHFLSDAGLYRLRLARDGHVTSFTTISTNLGLGQANNIDGIALSPDGTKLAVAVEITHGYTPEAEIVVIPLDHAPRRVWIDRHLGEFLWNPVWTSNKDIAFLWWDHLTATTFPSPGRTQERLLNTAAPGSSLLSSRVLTTASAKLGFISSAFATPHGGPIIAVTAQNVPATGSHGQATVRLVAISPKTGKVIKVFSSRVVHFRTMAQRSNADFAYSVRGLDPTGRDVLGYFPYPHFGELTDGRVTLLPSGPGEAITAAW